MILAQHVIRNCVSFANGARAYTLSCPPRTPPGLCGCGGRKPAPPLDCRPTKIAPNPCCPQYHHGHDTWKKYKYLTIFLLLPVIAAHTFNCMSHCPPHKGECREYEYMQRRTKRFPWGDGSKSLFHNDHVNQLPGDCTPAPLDCD